jgi:hypothetical protein
MPTNDTSEVARNVLRPDNYELFDEVRKRLNQRDPVIPIAGIAAWIGVTEDELIRWVIGFSEKGRLRSNYQSKKFAAIGEPRVRNTGIWTDDEDRRRARVAQKARDGARAAREAMHAK